MELSEQIAVIECMLFVAGDPIPMLEIQRVLNITELELRNTLYEMQRQYEHQKRGIQLSITQETLQLCSNKDYAAYVEQLLQPAQQKTFSQSLLETLAVIAYKQPVTRADIEAVRGVRCDYAVSQLVKLNMIRPVGRKDVIGRPVLYGTTDAFLRHFGITHTQELPNFEAYQSGEEAKAAITV